MDPYALIAQYPNAGDAFQKAFTNGQYKNALMAVASGSTDPRAMALIYGTNPTVGIALEDELNKRGERTRADSLRTAESQMLLRGGGAEGIPPADPTMSAAQATAPEQGVVTVAGRQLTHDQHADFRQYVGQLAQWADTPQKWNRAIGYLVSRGYPGAAQYRNKFSPELRQHFMAPSPDQQSVPGGPTSTADPYALIAHPPTDAGGTPAHIGSPDQPGTEAISGTPAYSPAEQAAISADPEKYLSFQGKRIALTKGQLANHMTLNNAAMQILGGVHDQASYDAAKQQAAGLFAQYGDDNSKLNLPDAYSPQVIHDLQMAGMDTSKQLGAIARENRLTADVANIDADNARADANAESLRRYREGRLQQLGRPKPQRSSAAPKAPTPSTVIGRIMDKQSRGEPLTAGEQQTLTEYRASKHSGRGSRAASAGNGAVIFNPKTRQRMQLQNGQWVPIK